MCVKVYVLVHRTCVNPTGVLFCVRMKLNGRRLYHSIFSGVCTLQYAMDHKLLLCPRRAILAVYGMDVSTLPKHQILSAIHVNLTIYSEPSVYKVRYHSMSRCTYLSSIYVEFATYKVHITDVCMYWAKRPFPEWRRSHLVRPTCYTLFSFGHWLYKAWVVVAWHNRVST